MMVCFQSVGSTSVLGCLFPIVNLSPCVAWSPVVPVYNCAVLVRSFVHACRRGIIADQL
jgi:hypothetical protein